MKTLAINSRMALEHAKQQLEDLWEEHRYLEVDVKRKAKQRSTQQNKALHLFCHMLAETLNDAGLHMRRVMREDVEIPWTMTSVKDHLWRPIQRAVIEKDSTADADTNEYTEVYDVLARHMASRLGVQVPDWPSAERGDET